MKTLIFNIDKWKEETTYMNSECKGWFLALLTATSNGQVIRNNFRALSFAADITAGEDEFERFKPQFKEHLAKYFKCNKEKTQLSLIKSCAIFAPVEKKIRVRKNFAPTPVAPEYQACFTKWLDYKKRRGQTYADEISVDQAYKLLVKKSNNNPVLAAEMIDDAIGMNYAGFFVGTHNNQKNTKFDALVDSFKNARNPHA